MMKALKQIYNSRSVSPAMQAVHCNSHNIACMFGSAEASSFLASRDKQSLVAFVSTHVHFFIATVPNMQSKFFRLNMCSTGVLKYII